MILAGTLNKSYQRSPRPCFTVHLNLLRASFTEMKKEESVSQRIPWLDISRIISSLNRCAIKNEPPQCLSSVKKSRLGCPKLPTRNSNDPLTDTSPRTFSNRGGMKLFNSCPEIVKRHQQAVHLVLKIYYQLHLVSCPRLCNLVRFRCNITKWLSLTILGGSARKRNG